VCFVQLGAQSSKLRICGGGKAGPVVTDNGNFIIDADFGVLENPAQLEASLKRIPGILETGLFCGMAEKAYFGMADGSVRAKGPKR
jgi:ribose 5-phosphate isomerase A